jgi:predicted small lipoprotein YifL
MKKNLLIALLIMLTTLAGCGNESPAEAPELTTEALDQSVEPQDLRDQVDLSLKPDESGRIMILMYHNIGEEEKEWVRTPENFLRDMTVLYEKGYRPISLRDYAKGYIDTEQGFTPVVLTFDDGNRNNFRYLDSGEIDPRSAVGLLLAFHESHPDFPLEATFFLNGPGVFQQKGTEEQKIQFLLERGMDVGNHTLEHANLSKPTGRRFSDKSGGRPYFWRI